jgi:hypothetical protein
MAKKEYVYITTNTATQYNSTSATNHTMPYKESEKLKFKVAINFIWPSKIFCHKTRRRNIGMGLVSNLV